MDPKLDCCQLSLTHVNNVLIPTASSQVAASINEDTIAPSLHLPVTVAIITLSPFLNPAASPSSKDAAAVVLISLSPFPPCRSHSYSNVQHLLPLLLPTQERGSFSAAVVDSGCHR